MQEVGSARHGILSVAAGEDYEWLYDFQAQLQRPISWNSILTFPASHQGTEALPGEARLPPVPVGGGAAPRSTPR